MSKFTPTTNKCIIAGLLIIGLVVIFGWAFGSILAGDALIIVMAIVTCFSTLLKGD